MIPASQDLIAAESRRPSVAKFRFFIGDYEIPEQDVLDGGSLTTHRPVNFSDLAAGDHTLVLENTEGRYGPNLPQFIFAGQSWFRKELRIYLVYPRPASPLEDIILLYRGLITKWESGELKIGSPESVQIQSKDAVALLGERLIGVPADSGLPAPAIYGVVTKPALDLKDNVLWTPNFNCDLETGDLSQFSSVVQSGGGTLVISQTAPYQGAYSMKCNVAAAGSTAYATMLLGAATPTLMVSAYFKFTAIPPAPITGKDYFMGIRQTAVTDVLLLTFETDGTLVLNDALHSPYFHNCSWNLNENLDTWVRITLAVWAYNPGVIKVYCDNDEVLSLQSNLSGHTYLCGVVGFYNVTGPPGAWEVYIDNAVLTNAVYPQGFYLPGYPFTSINRVYQGNREAVERYPKSPKKKPFKLTYQRGKLVTQDLYTTYPDYGLVNFNDVANPPTENIMLRVTKNTTNHPVDIIQALLGVAGLTSQVDAISFAAAKAATPGSVVGAHFENLSALEAVKSITGKCLYDLYVEQGQIRLLPYLGTGPGAPVMELSEADIVSASLNTDMDNLKTIVTGKYGWFEHDKSKFYRAKDAALAALIGNQEVEINMTWGDEVTSENADLITLNVDNLLTRLKSAPEVIEITGAPDRLKMIRLEMGDAVAVDLPRYFAAPAVFEVFGKEVNMNFPYSCRLNLLRFV